MRIAILGAGKIGEALLAGLRSSDWANLIASTRREERAVELRERHVAAEVPVVRSMPNAPSTVHEGIAGMCAGRHAEREHMERAGTVLRAVGDVVEVPEHAMDAITAVSGSGPAYY